MNPKTTSDGVAGRTEWGPDVAAWLTPYDQEIQGLQQTGQLFYRRGWSVGTSSNYSVVVSRDPLTLLITASGRDKGALSAADFVLVDQSGKPTIGDQPKASAETLIHCFLAQFESVNAVLHTHSVWSTVLSEYFSASGGFSIEDFEMLKGLEGITTHKSCQWVDVFDNSQDIAALVDTIHGQWSTTANGDSLLASKHGFLLRQHGLYTWGSDLFAARRHVEIFEFLLECVARKLMLQAAIQPQ